MTAFFSEVLDEFLSHRFLKEVRTKFHYGETHAEEFRTVAKEMLPLLREEAFWKRKETLGGKPRQIDHSDTIYENVVMSLGDGIDCLQEKYSKNGLLSQSYMVEVLSDELLMRGYEAYNRYVRESTVQRHLRWME